MTSWPSLNSDENGLEDVYSDMVPFSQFLIGASGASCGPGKERNGRKDEKNFGLTDRARFRLPQLVPFHTT